MNTHFATSTVAAPELSPERKRWENSYNNFRSAVGTALARELVHFSLPTPRSRRLRIGISLSSLNLSWSTN